MNEPVEIGIDGDPNGKTWRSIMQTRLLNRFGLSKFDTKPLPELIQTQRIPEFEDRCKAILGDQSKITEGYNAIVREFMQLARNRLIMGSIRYGQIGDLSKPKYNRFESIFRRMMLNFHEPNMEHLIDIFNEAGLEYTEPFGARLPAKLMGHERISIRYKADDIIDLETKKDVFSAIMSYMAMYTEENVPDCLVGIAVTSILEYIERHRMGQRPVAQDDGPVHTS